MTTEIVISVVATTAIAFLLIAMLAGIALLTRRVVRSEEARQLGDIRERERAERDSRARLQSIFDHVPAVLEVPGVGDGPRTEDMVAARLILAEGLAARA